MSSGEHAQVPGQPVLVVDDNPVTRYATARVLQAAGFVVREAGTGQDALGLAAADTAAVILDVNLPDMDGYQVCRQLRARTDTARLPVIHLSASHIMDQDKIRGVQSGADAYITHPADPALLVATVNALMRARAAEEGMRRSELRFRAIYDQALSGICLIDAKGRFAEVNPALCALLGRPESAIVGRAVTDFAAPEWLERVAHYLDASDTALRRGDFPLQDATGQPVYLEWSLVPQVEPGLSLAIATNISERVMLAQQRQELLEREQAARTAAERISRAKDEFIAVLSHELRTPLNAIGGWVHVLKRTGKDLERGLDAIERNVKTQTRLISDILDVSRMGLGKLRLELETVHVPQLLTAAVEALDASIRDKRLRVRVDADPAMPPIVADPARLQQIVWNLLTNAIKFSNAGGTVHVGLRQQRDALLLRVQDEGQGIRPDFLPYLFDRFSQSDSASNRFHGGLGLGLSIVQHLAELHGGTVVARSEGAGHGAVFEVTLPLRPSGQAAEEARQAGATMAPPAAEAGSRIADDALAGVVILAVDDDPDARDMLAVILRDRGARVTTAASYDEALERLQAVQPQVLVSDIGMPGNDGYSLMREIRAREAVSGARRLPAIALTAFTRPQDQALATAAGFDAHCPKPMRPEALVATVLRVSGRSAA